MLKKIYLYIRNYFKNIQYLKDKKSNPFNYNDKIHTK